MEQTTFIAHLNRSTYLEESEIERLKQICHKYPYFQSARALYLKGLHQQRSFLYNKELRKTAAHTTDRDILFDFIVSGEFVNYRPINIDEIPVYEEDVFESKKTEPTLNETIEKTVLETLVYIEKSEKESELIQKIDAIAQKKVEAKTAISDISSEENHQSVQTQSDTNAIIQDLEEKLEIGQPLEFSGNEKHSFTEWLQLTQMKPIHRNDSSNNNLEENSSQTEDSGFLLEQQEELNSEKIPFNPSKKVDPKKKKLEIIDRFIEANPKIIPNKNAPTPIVNFEPTEENQPYFMTETLAKIYLEQKKYQKAIQAYEILILKYPEKSSLFADRIKYIKELQQYNNL